MTTTQVPIIGWERRYMTPRECARLQSMHELQHLPEVSTRAFKALGNAVNAEIVTMIVRALVQVGLEDSGSAAQYVPGCMAGHDVGSVPLQFSGA
jgi:DNA (cytosine-5)-methyltransferase 1